MSGIIQNVQTALAENFTGSAQKAAPAGTNFSLNDVPDQTGKVAVVTGGQYWMIYPMCEIRMANDLSLIHI